MTKTLRVLPLLALLGLCGASFAAPVPSPLSAFTTKPAPFADTALPAFGLKGTGGIAKLNPGVFSAPVIKLALPDGRILTVVRQGVLEKPAKGHRAWVGKVEGNPGSILTLGLARGQITGFLTYGSETWEILPQEGKHLIYRVDSETLPTEEPEVYFKDLATPSASADAVAAAEGGSVIDLLVVYTTKAKTATGQATLESRIVNAVAAANQAYQNSAINITLNLVGLQELPGYTETGDMQATLNAIRSSTDGIMDDVHPLRDKVGADVVSLVSEDTSSCGIAGVMTTVSTAFASGAFNVVKTSCLSQHTLAHEIGHNQGNKHDRANATSQGAYPYSYGYRVCNLTDGTGFRSVMSYSCTNAPRVTQFSNPDVLYKGHPTGIDYETDPANSADNARSMNNTASTVAAFRKNPSEVAPAIPSNLEAIAISADTVSLKWTDASNNETGFKIERSLNGKTFAEIATLGPNSVEFSDNGLTGNTTYYYRVRAYNSTGNSGYSNVVTIKTPPASPPSTPQSFKVS
jgi:peptidyl-Asp metalloendopeptidase